MKIEMAGKGVGSLTSLISSLTSVRFRLLQPLGRFQIPARNENLAQAKRDIPPQDS